MREKILWNLQTFLFPFYTVQREDAHMIKPQLTVEIEA